MIVTRIYIHCILYIHVKFIVIVRDTKAIFLSPIYRLSMLQDLHAWIYILKHGLHSCLISFALYPPVRDTEIDSSGSEDALPPYQRINTYLCSFTYKIITNWLLGISFITESFSCVFDKKAKSCYEISFKINDSTI